MESGFSENDSRPLSLKLRIVAESSRIPENSGGRDQDATLTNAPNSREFGYAQLQRPLPPVSATSNTNGVTTMNGRRTRTTVLAIGLGSV